MMVPINPWGVKRKARIADDSWFQLKLHSQAPRSQPSPSLPKGKQYKTFDKYPTEIDETPRILTIHPFMDPNRHQTPETSLFKTPP